MKIYRIAEMNIAVDAKYKRTEEYMADYLVDSDEYELYIKTTDDMIQYEKDLGEEIHGTPQSTYISESVAILRVICDYIINRGGFFLHCSCLSYKGDGIIFTAPSGTGKSTHSALWRAHFGDDVQMINDDKPLVREKDGKFIIYGTPWRGKHSLGSNISAPIKAIVFIRQAPENIAERITPFEALSLIMQQTVLPTDKKDMTALLDILGRLLETVPMYKLGCTISDEAVTTVFDMIYSEDQTEAAGQHTE